MVLYKHKLNKPTAGGRKEDRAMKIVGMHYSTKPDGQQSTTLHVLEEFNEYYKAAASGRGCNGMKAGTIYVGSYDCTGLEVGLEIEIYYDRAVETAKGTFQRIKLIQVLNEK